MPRALVFLSFDMHRLAAKGIPPGDTNWVAQFPMIFFVFSWCERLGRGLMQTELGVIANTVSAGKWDRSQNLHCVNGSLFRPVKRTKNQEYCATGAWRHGGLRQAVTENYGSCLGRIAWWTKFASLCLGLMAKSNRGTVMFPSATIGRGVHSMVIACVPGSKLCKLGCVTTGEESVGLDYEQDWLVGLDHESSPYLCVHGDDRMIRYPGADDLTGEPGDA
ncbi:hypothetical protein DEO72_LG2g3768 [Vigna unguiculata]|uniref:Uncharacterized protein n=1 Tax=Vigna unguiculata TaxID=3917 RepID=A0A4D6L4S2_VIGUN|nr:hypothetical protein DEO72_LG2g3768 [Vigna unguiculata]